jgi:hypothetical protein
MLVSDAVDEDGRRKLVTKSDEAFGLLLIDNYIDKWSTTLTNVARAGMTTEKDADAQSDADPDGTKKKSTQQVKVDIASMVGGAVKELSVSMNSTILYRRTERANSHKKWKVNSWLFAGLRRELSRTAIGNVNRVVAMHWMKQRRCLLRRLGTWTTEY